MKISLIAVLLLSTTAYASTKNNIKLCSSTREYVASVTYLREIKAYSLNEKQIKNVADSISKGCAGAFNRFEKVIGLLTKVGIDSATALKNAKFFATSNDEQTESFIEIFKYNYNTSELNLDSITSLKLSLEIAKNISKNNEIVLQDFKDLVQFCKDDKLEGLPNAYCARSAAKVTHSSAKFNQSISAQYISLVEFISENSKGPSGYKSYALDLANKVILNGPLSAENFIDAYRFASSKKGLNYTAKDAISFAETMALRSFKLESEE